MLPRSLPEVAAEIVPALEAPQLLEQPPRAIARVPGRRDPSLDVVIAARRAAQGGGSLAAQPESLACLGARGDAHAGPPVDRRDLEARAKSRFGHRDRHGAVDVITDPPEEWMRRDARDEKEIARRAAVAAGAPAPGDADA